MDMMNAKYLAAALCGCVLAGCLTGCGPSAAARSREAALTAESLPEGAALSSEAPAGAGGEEGDAERFRPYEPFGLRYDAETDELWFDGRRVRWFEDYYPLDEDGAQAGTDFLDENGVVDVYAVRDREALVRRADGSYDPSGILTGVEAFSEEAFAARDMEALWHPRSVTAVAGDGELTAEDQKAMAEEYAPFGVTYDEAEDQWYYNGEAVCYLRDVLSSNGKSLTGGGFRGVIRTLSFERGAVRIEAVRDYARPDALGYGTLTGFRVMEDE